MFRPIGLTSLLALGLLVERAVAAPAPTPRSPAHISWGGCDSYGIDSTDPNLQCGTLGVPMDYHDDSAGTAHLAVIKYGATAPTKAGTIFFNPGGPGGSGLESVVDVGPLFSTIHQGTYDLISWDPRGVGKTVPGEVFCFDSPEADATFWDGTVVTYINESITGMFDQQDFDELYSQADLSEQKFTDFGKHCQGGPSGQHLQYLGMSSSVRDLVSLGDVIVGEGEPIDFYGVSYGSVIGLNFINMFPERAGRVVLDGVVDPSAWVSYKLPNNALLDSEKTYAGLADACAAAGVAGCKLVGFFSDDSDVTGAHLRALVAAVHDAALKLYRAGVPLPLAPGALKPFLLSVLYSPPTWSEAVNDKVYPIVAAILQTAQDNNITIGGDTRYNVPSGKVDLSKVFLSGSSGSSPQNLTSYSITAINGGDKFNDNGVTIKDVFDIIVDTTRKVTPTCGTIWGIGYDSYKWPVRSVEQLPPLDLKKLKVPALVIGNSADPITPYAGAQHAAELLGESAVLVQQLGYGHSSLAQTSSCTMQITANYFINSALPQGGNTECAVDPVELFPALDGNRTTNKGLKFLRKW